MSRQVGSKNKPKETNAQPEGGDVPLYHTLEWATERAAKIWEGQSPHLSILERVGRIKLGLGARGFTRFKELVLPTNLDYKKYL